MHPADVDFCTAEPDDPPAGQSPAADDRKRQRQLESAGGRIIRFGGAEVHADAAGCVRQLPPSPG